jgi:hypothetical protein
LTFVDFAKCAREGSDPLWPTIAEFHPLASTTLMAAAFATVMRRGRPRPGAAGFGGQIAGGMKMQMRRMLPPWPGRMQACI